MSENLWPDDSPRIVFGVTAAVTAQTFLRGQLSYFASKGWQVQLLCGEHGLADFAIAEGGVVVHYVPVAREPALGDPLALIRIWRVLRGARPDVAIMGTPKMGVLGIVAAFLARVPGRVYLLHGFRAEGLSGLRGFTLRSLDRLACSLATRVVAVSPSLRDELVARGVVSSSRVVVLGNGSANGIDTLRFSRPILSDAADARRALGIPESARVVAFVGRLTRDKGLNELVGLWDAMAETNADRWLLVAGSEEPVDEHDRESLVRLWALPRVVRVGHTDNVEEVYHASDVLLMLSAREGLGMVVLEAAACNVPAVAFRATGVQDAIVDSETGFLCGAGDVVAVENRVHQLLADDHLRQTMGEAGRSRVVDHFSQEAVWLSWEQFVKGMGDVA